MTAYTVSTATQLTSTLNLAKAGDSIILASGNYGDVSISKQFATDVTITAQTEGAAVFKSLTLNDASHIKIDGVAVNFTPTAATYTWTPAVGIYDSDNITFIHGTVTGGAAVSGVAQTATYTDFSGNVLGLATGYGISVSGSTGVTVDSTEVSNFYKGISLYKSDYVTISHDDVHDTRTTSIVAAGGSHITIDSNHLHDVKPWAWDTSYGDHGDFLAMWTNSGQTTASTDIKVTNNLMEQGAGKAVLGMWLQGDAAGYTNVTISGNAILNGNYQGILLWDVTGGTIDHNTLLQTSGTDWKTQPGVILGNGAEQISVHDNKVGSIEDKSGSTGSLANTIFSNTLVTKWTSGLLGSYTNDLIAKTEALYDSIVDAGTTVSAPTTTTPTTTTPTTTTPTTTTPTTTTPTTSTGTSSGSTTTTPTDTTSTGTVGKIIEGTWEAKSLFGTAGNDTFISKSGNDVLTGGAGNDTYNFSASKTLVVETATGGTDTVIVKGDYTLAANVENLTISSAADNNWSGTGNSLNNVITGNIGGNYLDGVGGNDTIFGGAGNDFITGGAGNDQLTGGTGKDTFKFASGSGQDKITDFSKADHDVIDISAFTKVGYKAVLTDVGTDVKISFATGDAIVLTGVHAKDLIATSAGFTA